MSSYDYADLSAICAFIALLAIIAGFFVAFTKRRSLVLGVTFDSQLPSFANDHHRRDYDVLIERWSDARIWLRTNGRLVRDRAPAVPMLLRKKPGLRVA